MIFWVWSILLFLPYSKSLDFKIDRFDADATNILYREDAIPSVGTIEFNKVSSPGRVGQAIYYDTVPIWDRKSGKLTDFTTHFTFIIDTQGRSPSGDGLAFFLAPTFFQIPPTSSGCFLGLFNDTYKDSPRNQMIVIEFDSFVNDGWDPPYQHVGINKNSIQSAVYTAWNTSLHSGVSADAWVSYNSTTQLLNLRWSYSAGNDTRGNLSYKVDLREVLPERVMVGFSAATGTNVERHILQSWEFSSSLKIKENDGDNSKEWKLAVWIGIGVALGVLVLVACVVYWRKQRKPAVETVPLTSMNDDLERRAGPTHDHFVSENVGIEINQEVNQIK